MAATLRLRLRHLHAGRGSHRAGWELVEPLAAEGRAADRPGRTPRRDPRGGDRGEPLVIPRVIDYNALYALLDGVPGSLTGRAVVNLTSGSPEQAHEALAWFGSRGADYLDGAIMTTPPGVGNSEVMFLYSGPREVFRRPSRHPGGSGRPRTPRRRPRPGVPLRRRPAASTDRSQTATARKASPASPNCSGTAREHHHAALPGQQAEFNACVGASSTPDGHGRRTEPAHAPGARAPVGAPRRQAARPSACSCDGESPTLTALIGRAAPTACLVTIRLPATRAVRGAGPPVPLAGAGTTAPGPTPESAATPQSAASPTSPISTGGLSRHVARG